MVGAIIIAIVGFSMFMAIEKLDEWWESGHKHILMFIIVLMLILMLMSIHIHIKIQGGL